MNITCALSPRQIESLYANVYGHLSKNKSFDPETYMRNLFNKIAEKTNPDNAAKFLQYVPDIMYKASAQLGLDNLPEGFDFNRIRDLNKIFKDPERGLLNIIDVFKKDDTPLLRQLAELEKELALKQEQIETEEPPVKNPDRYLASQTFTGTGSPFVKINPNDKKTLEPTTLDKSKKSFINTFDKLEKAFQISENPDLFEYQGVQVKIKAQILSEFVRTNNISLLYTDTQNEYNRSIDIVTEGKQKEDVFQNNQRVILVLVDEAGENLYFDQDGNITTKENGQIFYQFLRAARKTNSGFTVKDMYNIEDQVKDSKDKQKEFETLYNIQESLKSNPDAVQFLPFIGVTSGVNSDLSSIVIGIKDLIEQPTVNKNVVNTLDIAGEFDEQIRNGFAYIVLNNNKFEITRPQITETIASEIAELLMNPNIPVDTKIKVLEGYSSRTLTSKVKKHKYTNDGVFMIYAKTGLEGVRQDIKFTSEAISKMSDDEILNNITAIKNAYLKGYNSKPTFFTYEKDFINKTKPFLRYDVNTKQIKVDNNYVDFITQFNQDVRLINGDPGFYNKQIVFGAPDGPISLLQDSQTETIDENLNSVPGTVNEIKEVHAALVERLKKGENITGDIIFPEGSITRFSFVEPNGKIADAYNTAENKDIVIINEENFGLEIDALRNSNNYLGVTAELKYRDKVDEFDDVIEVYIGDKYVGNIRVSTDEEFEAQKKKDLSVENPSFQSQQINNNDLNTPQTSLDLDFDRSNYPDDKPTKEMISAAEKWWKTSKTGKIFRENNIGFSFAMNLVNSNVYAKFVTSGSNLLNPDDPFIASILINPAKGTFVDLYHESWHVFSQLFLTKAEKFALYDEVKNYKDSSGKQPYINMDFFEIEEMLAEDFRSYAKNQSVKKDSPKRNSLFRRILKFLKALFGIKNPSAHEVKMDIMNVPRVAELYNNLYIGNINNYEPTINNIYFFELDRGVSNVNYPKYEALSTGDSQQLSRSIDNLIVEEIKAIYDERKDAGLPNLKATALGMLLLEKNRAYLYNRIKQRLQDKLDEEKTKLGAIKGVPLLSTFKTKQDFKDHAVAIMNNTKGRDKYVLLKSQIDDYNLLDADLKNGDRVKGEKWHSIKIVGDFYTHKELKDVDIIVVSKYEDAEIQLKNYIEGGAEAYDKIIPVNPTFSDQVLTPEQEVLSDNIRILQTAISNWGNDSKGVIQYHMNNSDFEILKKSVEVDIEEDIDSDDNVKDPNNPAETHRDSSNLADEKNLKTKLQDLLGSETKFILKSLTKVDFEGNPVKDKFGFNERADFRKVFTQVAKTIGGIQDRNEVYRLLSEEASKKDKDGNLIFPELNELIEYKLPDPKNIGNRFEAKVSLSFWQDFSRPRIKYWNLLGVPIVKEIDMGGVLEKTPVGYDFIFTQSSIEVSSIMKGWLNRYSTSPNTKYLKKTEDNKRELKLSKIVQEFSNSKGELDKTKDFEFANAIGIYFDDVTAIKDDLSQKREYYGLPYIFRILKTYEQIEQNPSNYSPLQVESAARFKQNPLTVLNSEIGAGIVDKSAVNQKTQVKRMIELQAKYGYDSANLGVLLPNNNIAYENSDMSAMLEKTNALNSAKSFADLIKNYPHMRYLDPKINTFTKRLTLLNQLFDLNNPMAERNDKTLETIYIAGFKPEGEVGQATTELDPLGRFLLGFSNVLLGGVDELPRMSEKKSSFAIRLKGGLQGGVTPTGITKGDDLYLYADLPMFREISKAREYIFETHMLNYIAAEFDRIKKFRNPKKRPDLLKISGFNRPVGISQNGKEVVEGDIFSAFDTILRNSTKRDLYALADDQLEMDIVDYIRQNRDLYDKIFNDITEYFNFQTQSHIDLYYNKIPFVSKSILEKMFNRELNDNEILDLRKNTKVINRLMQAYLYNDWIHKFETSIILMGDFAQWNHFKEDWPKRIPGVQSSGYSILNDKDWQNYMKTVEMTEDKTYAGKLSKQLDRKDLNNYIFSEKIITGVIKDAQRKSIYLDDLKEAWREAYESYPSLSKEDIDNYVEEDADAYAKMDESDGIAFITFDAYRALSISGRKWSVSQEDLFQKIANGDKVTPAQVLEAFPIRKYHYFGSLENDFIATTAMHKFSVMPLIPNGNAKEGSELYKLHLKMLKDNVQYVTFESGSKGSYLTEDGQVNNLFATKEDKDLNEEAVITANPIYLNYLKEVTVINDKLKNVIPIATQTRFVIYDNLFDNGKLINEKNKPLVDDYNTNVKNLTELYKRELLDEIGFEEVDGNYVGNLKRFVEVIRDELGKRNVPYHIQKLVDTSRKGDHLRYDLSLIPEAEKIEKLILSIIQNRIVRQKTKGEPMVQAPSTFTNGLWDTPFAKDEAIAKNKELEKKFLGSNTLPFYRRGEIINKKTGERSPTYLAKVAIPFNGDFVNLLNLEWQGSKIQTMDRLNELIKTDEFLNQHREALTLVGPRIPNDGTNTIEAFEVWHFVDASVLNTVIVPTELVAKSGSDFDGDKLFLTMPHIDKTGKVINTGPATYEDFINEYERLKSLEAEGKLSKDDLKPKKYLEQVKKYYQNKYITSAANIIKIPENFAYLTKPNKTYLVQKYVADLEKGSNLYNRYDNPHKIASITNSKGQKRLSPSTLLTAAYNLYKFDANLSLEPALGITAKVNKNHIMYKTLSAPMPLVYKKQVNLGNGLVDETIDVPMHMRFKVNKINIDGKDHISLSGAYTSKGPRITDVNSHNLNGILDRGKESWPFILQLFPEAIGVINYLIQVGVSEEEVFYLMNQPLVKQYIENIRKYNNAFSPVLTPGTYARFQAKQDALSNIPYTELIKVGFKANELKLKRHIEFMSGPIKVNYKNKEGEKVSDEFSNVADFKKSNLYKNELQKISSIYDLNPDSNVVFNRIDLSEKRIYSSLINSENYVEFAEAASKYIDNTITIDKLKEVKDSNDMESLKALAIFANYIELENQKTGLDNFQIISSYDTDKLSTVQQVNKRRLGLLGLKSDSKIDDRFVEEVMEKSIMKNFNNTDLIIDIAESVLPFRLHPVTTAFIEITMSNSKVKRRFGEGVAGEEKFTKNYNNAILNNLFQNRLTYFYNEDGIKVTVPEEFHSTAVKINNSIENEVNITEDSIEVNLDLLTKIYENRAYLAKNFTVDKNYTALGYHTFIGGNLNPFKNLEQFVKFVMHREYIRKDKPLSSVKDNIMYKNILEESTSESAAYEKFLAENALYQSFNPAYITGTTTMSYYDLVMRTIIDNKILTNTFPVLNFITQATLKNPTLKLFDFSDGLSADGDIADSYKNQLDQLGDIDFSKYAGNEYKELNKHISNVFKYFSEAVYFQHGVGKNRFGYANILNAEKFTDLIKQPVLNFQKNVLSAEDPFEELNSILQILLSLNEFKNYTETPVVQTEVEEEDEEGSTIVFPSVKPIPSVKSTQLTAPASTGVKVISPDYGVVQTETNPTKVDTQTIIDLIAPQIEKQAYKENIGVNANWQFSFGNMWSRVNLKAKPLLINSFAGVNKVKTQIEELKKTGKLVDKSKYIYDYHELDQDGNPLPPISDLQPLINKIQNALGIDMSGYDSVLGNIYLDKQSIAPHRDTTEAKSAEGYPVIVYTIGNDSGLGIWDDNKGKMTFQGAYKEDYQGRKPTNEILTKDGTIYTFGMDGKGRFTLSHTTPLGNIKKNPFPAIKLSDGRTLTNYTITLTFRRAADLEPGMPKTPAKLSTQPTVSRGFQGYKGGFEDKGKGTPQGDGKDKAMREVAGGFILELDPKRENDSSTGTTAKEYPNYREGVMVSSKNFYNDVVMLARNNEFKNKPLSEDTKRSILDAHDEGISFVVGDMPGVDSQFIDYLQEIGAKFTIYHTGSTPRIQITQPTTAPVATLGPETKINIYAGTRENAELSNFAERPFIVESEDTRLNGIRFNTVEGAFQAAKLRYTSLSLDKKIPILDVLKNATGAEAKKIGRQITGLDTKAWDNNSSRIMKDLIKESFKQNRYALAKLLATGNATLTHTQDTGKWGKEFPRLLMEVRDELRTIQTTEGSDQYYQLKNIYNSATELETKLKSFNKTAKAIGSNKKIDELLKKLNIESQVRNQFIQLLEDNPELKDLKLSDVMSSYLKEFIKDSDKQYYTAIQEELDSELEDTLIDYFSRFNIRRQELDNLKEKFGVDTVGVFDVLAKTIYYSKNRNLLTLPEEYGHVFVELLGSVSKKGADNPLFNYLINNIENWDGYNRVFNDYKDVYVTDEGNIDIYKIKKEAIGQAIGIALVRNYKVQKGDKGFWSKIQQVIDYILNLIGGINYVSLNTTVDSIAKDILSKNYLKLDRLNKDTSNYNLLSYSETIKLQNQKDNGRALNFMKWFSNKGMIITGSLAYRLQGTVYRPAIDALHDIDNIVPSDVHGMNLLKENFLSPEELANDKLYRKLISEGNYKEANKYKLKGGNIRLNVDDIYNTVPILQEFQKEFPDTDFLYSFYNQKANAYYVTINAIWSEDQSLKDRFKAYSGSFNQRLLNFTEEELDKIYLFDFFLRPETSEEYVKIDDPEFGLTLAHFNYAFYEKLNMMGRAKDAYDYQMWDYFNDDNILAPDFNDRLVYFQINRNSLDTTLKAQSNTNLNLFGLEGYNIPDTGDKC